MHGNPTAEFPLPLGLVGTLTSTMNLSGIVRWGLTWDAAAGVEEGKPTGELTGDLSVSATASGSVGLGVGLGAGVANVANAGVTGNATLEASATARAGVDARLATDGTASAEGKAGVTMQLVGSFEIVPYISLKCIGKRFAWPIKLVGAEFLTWEPSIGFELVKGNFRYKGLEDTNRLKLHVPDFVRADWISSFLNWMNEDDDAHAAVQELKANGLLDTMSSGEKARLMSAIRDFSVGKAHEGSLLELLDSEPDEDRRWQLAMQAYERDTGKQGTRKEVFGWLEGSMNNHWFGGPRNDDRLKELLPLP